MKGEGGKDEDGAGEGAREGEVDGDGKGKVKRRATWGVADGGEKERGVGVRGRGVMNNVRGGEGVDEERNEAGTARLEADHAGERELAMLLAQR